MYIVIAGAGRVGGQLAQDLTKDGHDVAVIDNNPDALDDLGNSFNGLAIMGMAYDVDVLAEAKVAECDVFCAMTDDDNTNLMAVEVAKAVYGAPRVLARLHDPAREESYRVLGIPYLSTTNIIAAVALETIVSDEFPVHVTFRGGEVEIVEFTLSPEIKGMMAGELEIDQELRIAAIRRHGTTIIPHAATPLLPGDLIVAAAHHGVRTRINAYVEDANRS